MDSYLKQLVKNKTEECLKMASVSYGRTFVFPKIDWSLRGRVAGQAIFCDWKIRINMYLLRENTEDYLKRTVPHEVAHLVARLVYGTSIKPHGREWKSVMGRFGVKAVRCHSYKTVPARKTRTFIYACDCRNDIRVGIVRQKRILKGTVYLCQNCKTQIKSLTDIKKPFSIVGDLKVEFVSNTLNI